LASRKIASILTSKGKTLVKTVELSFPLWTLNSHIKYLESFDYTDIIVSSSCADELLLVPFNKNINYIAGISWSEVHRVVDLFNHGFSKIFLGGREKKIPTHYELSIFNELLLVYGGSAFGYSCHFREDNLPILDVDFVNKFSEITFISDTDQVVHNAALANSVISKIRNNAIFSNKELNLIHTNTVSTVFNDGSLNINMINYSKHASHGNFAWNV